MVSPEGTMSFENAFEKWLGSSRGGATMEEEQPAAGDSDDNNEGTQDTAVKKEVSASMEVSGGESDGGCEAGMPVIERMAWQEEDLKGMPVLQRMVDIPSNNSIQAARSPQPPPLQISLSLKRCSTQGKRGKKSKSDIFRVESRVQEKSESGLTCRDKYSSHDTLDEKLQKTSESKSKDHQHHKVKKHRKKRSKSPRHSSIHKKCIAGPEIRAAQGDSEKSVSALTAFEPSYSPGPGGDATSHTCQHRHGVQQKDAASVCLDEAGSGDVEPSVVRRTTVLSPDRGNVEPDSTSEISGAGSRSSSQHTDSDMDVDKGSSCSATSRSVGCVHAGRGGDVSMRVEEGMGECDSTSMFLASPSAISPASQGDIEERLCPVLTDHEDGSHHASRWSPGHCICQCRSFLSATDLITPTTNTITMGSNNSKSAVSLVVRDKNIVCCQAAPCLEKMTLADDVNSDACVREEGCTESPPVLSPTQLEHGADCEPVTAKNRQDSSDDHQRVLDSDHQETPPSLTRYETGIKDNGGDDRRSPNLSESPPVLTLPEHAERVFADTVKSEHRSREKISKDIIDSFSPDIKWESAVATVETKPSPNRGGVGDGKPGIVIKIRTKAATKTIPTFSLSVPDTETRVEPADSEMVPVAETKVLPIHSLTVPMADRGASPAHSVTLPMSERKASPAHPQAVSEIKASPAHPQAVSESERKASPAHPEAMPESEKKASPAHPQAVSESERKASPAHSRTVSKSERKASPAHPQAVSESERKASPAHPQAVSKSERKAKPAHSRSVSRAESKLSLHSLTVSEAESKASPVTVPKAETKASPLTGPKAETKASPLTGPKAETKALPVCLPISETKVAPAHLLTSPRGDRKASQSLAVPDAEANVASSFLLAVPDAEANVASSFLLAVPEEEPSGLPQESQQPMAVRKKRHTIDSPEMARRLRKRRKTGDGEKGEVGKEDSDGDVKHSESCLAQNKWSRPGQITSCRCSHAGPQRGRRRRNTVHLGSDLTCSLAHLPPAQHRFVLSSARLSRLQTRAHSLVSALFPRLAPLLLHLTPESQQFEKTIDDIIGSLQRSEMEETNKDSEELSRLLRELSLGNVGDVPVFSPQVVLCRSPGHALETFQDKVCAMLQLLLPDITVSLTNNTFHNSEELEVMIDMVIAANKGRVAKKTE